VYVCPRTHVCVFQINILSIFKSATDGPVSSFDYPLQTRQTSEQCSACTGFT